MKIARREYSSVTEIASFDVNDMFMTVLADALKGCHPVNKDDVMPTIDEAAIAAIVGGESTAYDEFMIVAWYDCEMSLADAIRDFIDDWFCGNAEYDTVDQDWYEYENAYVVPEDAPEDLSLS